MSKIIALRVLRLCSYNMYNTWYQLKGSVHLVIMFVILKLHVSNMKKNKYKRPCCSCSYMTGSIQFYQKVNKYMKVYALKQMVSM